ncbi:MAG: response regulator [Allorhizobium sp.]
MTSPIDILLADDHPLVLAGLKSLLSELPDVRVSHICTDGRAALLEICATRPDIAILDFNMPLLNGLEVLQEAKRRMLPTSIVILSAMMSDHEMMDIIDAGAAGIVLKSDATSELTACLAAVRAKQTWFPVAVQGAIDRESERRGACRRLTEMLTDREIETARLAARNMSNKAIAYVLGIAEGTVKLHLNSVYNKLGVQKRDGLIAVAAQYGLF